MARGRETRREARIEGSEPETAGTDRTGEIDAQMAAIEAAHPKKLDLGFRPDIQIATNLNIAINDVGRMTAERDAIKKKAPRNPAVIMRRSALVRGETPAKYVPETPELDTKIKAARAEAEKLRTISEALTAGDTGPADEYFKGIAEGFRDEMAASQEEIERLRREIASGQSDLAEMGASLKEAAERQKSVAGKLRRVIDQRQYLKLTAQRPHGPEQLAA